MGIESNMTAAQAPTVSIRTNREFMSHQIHDCLAVIASLTNCLRVTTKIPDPSGETPGIPALDGGACSSLEVSLRKACDRLDKLMEVEERWTPPETDCHTLGIKFFTQEIMLKQQALHEGTARLKAYQDRLDNETEVLKQMLPDLIRKRFGDAEQPPEPPQT